MMMLMYVMLDWFSVYNYCFFEFGFGGKGERNDAIFLCYFYAE